MKSGNIQYWKEQLETSSDIVFTLLVMLTWATPRVIDSLKTELNIIIQNLSLENYIDLSNLVSRLDNNKSGSEKFLNNILIDRDIADEFKFLLRNRLTFENRYNLIVYNINFEKEKLIEFSGFSMVFLIREFLKKPNDKLLLEKIRSIYSNSFDSFSHFPRGQKSAFIPYDLAKTIITSPLSYPRYIVSIAEKSCLQYSNSKIIPVGKIAEKEKWFE